MGVVGGDGGNNRPRTHLMNGFEHGLQRPHSKSKSALELTYHLVLCGRNGRECCFNLNCSGRILTLGPLNTLRADILSPDISTLIMRMRVKSKFVTVSIISPNIAAHSTTSHEDYSRRVICLIKNTTFDLSSNGDMV